VAPLASEAIVGQVATLFETLAPGALISAALIGNLSLTTTLLAGEGPRFVTPIL
jgi:hypothetical protein